MKKLMSKSGLTVSLSDSDYAQWVVEHGERAREMILTHAGRVHSHRMTVRAIEEQELTPEQAALVRCLADSMAREDQIRGELCRRGYEHYVQRSAMGGLMPDSWSRTVRQAAIAVESDEIVSDHLMGIAMHEMGYYSQQDREWSESIARSSWVTVAPPGWGVHTS